MYPKITSRSLFALAFLLSFVELGLCQFDKRIGEWTSYLPYQNGQLVTQSSDQIIYATELSIFTIDKEDFSANFLSKVEGLSDIGISKIKYDLSNDQLVIAYNNSNIDIISGGDIINLPDIKSNRNISGDKQIYSLEVLSDRYAYVATGFGLVQIDLVNYNFGFTVFTGVRVNDVASLDNFLYISTEDGLYRAPTNQNLNLADFNNWDHLETDFGLPLVYATGDIELFNGQLFFEYDRRVMSFVNGGAEEVFRSEDSSQKIDFLTTGEDYLIMGFEDNAFHSDVYFLDKNQQIFTNGNNCINSVTGAIQDEQEGIWYADIGEKIRYSTGINDDCETLTFNSPFSSNISDIYVNKGQVFVASGGATENYGYQFNRKGFYHLNQGSWTNFNENNFNGIRENDLLNFFKIISHPSQDRILAGTYWGGIMDIDLANQSTSYYVQENSGLQGITGDEQRERITGMVYDDNENLWISNFGAPRPLVVFTAEGQWHSYEVNNDTRLTQIVIDQYGYKWAAVFGGNGGILVYDDRGTLDNSSDDRQIFINQNNSALVSNAVNDIDIDRDGTVWVGTPAGPFVFNCSSDIFETGCSGNRLKIEQDSITELLLNEIDIRAIEIDGANQKWFGTRDGIFVMSANGLEEVDRFTTDNSPLFADNIIDLAYNGSNGEMYIGSDKGLQSIRTSSIDGTPFHSNNVYAFPNPVRPEYTGPIAIRGLASDANVKITTQSGQIVYETRAHGGQAIWDGRRFDGQDAAAGVYLIFSSSTNTLNDPDSFVSKLLIIR